MRCRSTNLDQFGQSAIATHVQRVSSTRHELTFTEPAGGTPDPVASEGAVSLSATAVDSLGHTVSYAWQATCAGLPTNGVFAPSATVQAPTWTAPQNLSEATQECAIQVTAIDGHGASANSAYAQHVEPVPVCASFSKTTPKNLATNQPTSLAMAWTSSGAGCRYGSCVDKGSTNNNLCDTAWLPAGRDTSASVPGLAFSSSHYWQVRATNGATPPTYVYANATALSKTGTWWKFTTARKPTLTVSASPLLLDEATGRGELTVKRSGDTSQDLHVAVAVGGSATPGGDVTIEGFDEAAPTLDLTLRAGETQVTVPVASVDDMRCEGDETVTLTLLAGDGFLVGAMKTATVTVVDDEVAPDGIGPGGLLADLDIRRGQHALHQVRGPQPDWHARQSIHHRVLPLARHDAQLRPIT